MVKAPARNMQRQELRYLDSDVLNSIPDCKECKWWYDPPGECKKPGDIECPKGVEQPQQEYAEN